jgi:hypothetical protein
MQQSRQPWHYRRKVCVLRPPSESAKPQPGSQVRTNTAVPHRWRSVGSISGGPERANLFRAPPA